MRPRIVRRFEVGGRKLPQSTLAPRPISEPTSLRCASLRGGASGSAELWIGVSLLSPTATALEELATRAQRFTPRVSLLPPDGLLLEVQGSLHLFNGARGLLEAVASDCRSAGWQPALALAPTALAAIVAARAGQPWVVTELAQLRGQLSRLPLAPLRWPQELIERLARMGVRTIGQVLRLPRAGFARRFGPGPLAQLDRLTGRSADVRARFHSRERFRRRHELTYEVENTASLLGTLTPVFAELERFLQARQCGITQLECRLQHRHAPASSCLLRLATPLANVERLAELLGERLHALVLPEAVRSCELRTGALVRLVQDSRPLWRPGEHGAGAGAESPELLERLRSRLGSEAVYGLRIQQDHRPENAWSVTEPVRAGTQPAQADTATACARSDSAAQPSWPAFRRPLWLLRKPRLLRERDGLPVRRGSLRLTGDPERIETGWWDGNDIERHYYTAVDVRGVRLWIFHECSAPHRWFLHGVFG